MNYARQYQTCVVNNFDENNPYLYIFGGDSVYIERINLNNLDTWYVLSQRFDSDSIDGSSFSFDSAIRHFAIVSYYNYIFLINGYDEWNGGEHEIFALNVQSLDMELFGTSVARSLNLNYSANGSIYPYPALS